MFYFILVTLVLVSCKKEVEFDARLTFRFKNLSDLTIDSLKIYSTFVSDSVVFENIIYGHTTEFKEFHDVDIDPSFVIYFDNMKLIEYWECPKYVVDPAGKQYLLLQSGSYTFGIFDYDTISNRMLIGLIDFSKNLYQK